MKTMKIFLSMAALALVGVMMTGCSSDDNFAVEQQPENKSNVVTLTTTVSMAGGETRALTATGVKTFAVGEQMAVVYNNGTSTVKAVSHELQVGDITNNGKTASFSFDLETPNVGENVTYIYPASMAGETGVNYTNLYWQQGTLNDLASEHDLATKTAAWAGTSLPSATLENQLAILAITLKDISGSNNITSSVTDLVLSDGTNAYTVSGHDSDGHIYVAIRPTNSADITITATDGSKSYKKSLAGKTYEANNGYNVSWKMQESELPATYYDPQGNEIQDYAVISWLRLYGFTQADINALGNDETATNKLYECWLYNCDFTVNGAGCVSVTVPETTTEGGYIKTATVQLTRKAPLGAINGFLYFYKDDDEDNNPILDESVEFFGDNNNPNFPIAPTTSTVTQTVTATINTDAVQATTIRAKISPFIPDEPEEPWEEPEPEGEE